jgi:hypothetical protein
MYSIPLLLNASSAAMGRPYASTYGRIPPTRNQLGLANHTVPGTPCIFRLDHHPQYRSELRSGNASVFKLRCPRRPIAASGPVDVLRLLIVDEEALQLRSRQTMKELKARGAVAQLR